MVSFRTTEDERRYLALRTEIYVRLAMNCPTSIAHEIMRNLGKLEAFVHIEGIRQGAIAAVLCSDDEDPENFAALAQHAKIYGGADTPLTRCERATLEASGYDVDAVMSKALFDASPTRFAPTTLQEAIDAYGPDLVPSPGVVPKPRSQRTAPIAETYSPLDEPDDDSDVSERRAIEALTAIENGDDAGAQALLDQLLAPMPGGPDRPPESPDFLDRVRDTLLMLLRGEWKPKSWGEMIMKLHLTMVVDAGFLELNLSSPMGQTVLAQVGLMNLDPGMGAMFDSEGTLETVTR